MLWIRGERRESIARMIKPSLAAAAALSIASVTSLLGCVETYDGPVEHGHHYHQGVVPFRGVYQKFAESTFKNGRRIRVANANGPATVRIDRNKVTYDQAYVSNGEMKRVVQVYTFRSRDVHAMGGGDYEVNLTFRGIGGDTRGYSPDRNDPKLEAHRSGSGWEIYLYTTDNNGVIGVVELQ